MVWADISWYVHNHCSKPNICIILLPKLLSLFVQVDNLVRTASSSMVCLFLWAEVQGDVEGEGWVILCFYSLKSLSISLIRSLILTDSLSERAWFLPLFFFFLGGERHDDSNSNKNDISLTVVTQSQLALLVVGSN